MARRPKTLKEIPCYCCDYQRACDEYVKVDPRMSTQRDKMYNDADLNCMDCVLRNVLKMRKESAS